MSVPLTCTQIRVQRWGPTSPEPHHLYAGQRPSPIAVLAPANDTSFPAMPDMPLTCSWTCTQLRVQVKGTQQGGSSSKRQAPARTGLHCPQLESVHNVALRIVEHVGSGAQSSHVELILRRAASSGSASRSGSQPAGVGYGGSSRRVNHFPHRVGRARASRQHARLAPPSYLLLSQCPSTRRGVATATPRGRSQG